MERLAQIKKLSEKDKVWDIVVVGGGATGLGVAVDAATRGLSVALLEKTDFAKCTSSRSTKLVHGGVRYLQKGDVMLVLEALRERGRMKANAPHLVKDQAFVISNYSYWDNFLYFCGLTFYDMLSFGFGYGRSKFISAKKVMKYIPTSVEKGLKGGVVYHDGQFDDSRMAINLAQTCIENGGTVVNQASVTGIVHDDAGRAAGVKFVDNLTGEEHTIKARSVVNAAGCFVDDIMHMDSPTHRKMVTPSQGVHLVLDMKFLQSDYAIMVPKTSDGRVLFAVPWHDKVVVGTTDIVRPKAEEDPRPLKEEIDFILGTAGLYMNPAPTYKDILSVFAGQRPLAAPKKEGKNTKEISRSHKIIVSDNGLVTITGGKWTSYGGQGDRGRQVARPQVRDQETAHPRLPQEPQPGGSHVRLRQRRAQDPRPYQAAARTGRETLAQIRLYLCRGAVGRTRGDGHDGRGRAFAPCAPALRRCPRSHRGGAEGSRAGTRPGLDRHSGKRFHGFGENVYL